MVALVLVDKIEYSKMQVSQTKCLIFQNRSCMEEEEYSILNLKVLVLSTMIKYKSLVNPLLRNKLRIFYLIIIVGFLMIFVFINFIEMECYNPNSIAYENTERESFDNKDLKIERLKNLSINDANTSDTTIELCQIKSSVSGR
jgi:hypothetical protein